MGPRHRPGRGRPPDAADAIETDIKALARERISGISNAAPRDMEALEKAIQAGETGSEDDIDARLATIRETASSALDKLSSAGRQRLTRQRRAAPKPVTMLAAAQLPRPAPLLSAPLPETGGGYVLSFGEVMVLAGEGGAGHCARCGASEVTRRAPYRIEAQRVSTWKRPPLCVLLALADGDG